MSADGVTWSALEGDFTVADRRPTTVALPGGTAGVQYIRYTMIGTQVVDVAGTCPANFSGLSSWTPPNWRSTARRKRSI